MKTHCEFCGRAERLTKHHLIPKTRHKTKRNIRTFSRQEVRTRILWLCHDCHQTVHATFTEKELEFDYNTREKLMAHPEIAKFVKWVSRRSGRISIRPSRCKLS